MGYNGKLVAHTCYIVYCALFTVKIFVILKQFCNYSFDFIFFQLRFIIKINIFKHP